MAAPSNNLSKSCRLWSPPENSQSGATCISQWRQNDVHRTGKQIRSVVRGLHRQTRSVGRTQSQRALRLPTADAEEISKHRHCQLAAVRARTERRSRFFTQLGAVASWRKF